MKTVESRIMTAGFLLVGLAVALTAVSYVVNMIFQYQWLVWVVGAIFAAVTLLTLEWPRAFRSSGELPLKMHRQLLLFAIPFAFVVSSQVCGLGTSACNTVCHITNFGLIGLGATAAFRLNRGQTVAPVLIPLVVIALIPHCVCHAPINLLWHSALGGVAPTCEMVPLAATLFSVSALRGVRTRSSTALVVGMFGVMIFIIVGGSIFGFPWRGCVEHPI